MFPSKGATYRSRYKPSILDEGVDLFKDYYIKEYNVRDRTGEQTSLELDQSMKAPFLAASKISPRFKQKYKLNISLQNNQLGNHYNLKGVILDQNKDYKLINKHQIASQSTENRVKMLQQMCLHSGESMHQNNSNSNENANTERVSINNEEVTQDMIDSTNIYFHQRS